MNKNKTLEEIKKEIEQKVLVSLNLFAMGVQTGNIAEEENLFTKRITYEVLEILESTISQTKQELIEDIKKSLPSHPDGMISRNEVKRILDRI